MIFRLHLFAVVASIAPLAQNAHALETWRGPQRALVMLVEWPNEQARVTSAEIERTFFSTAEADRSLRQFFLENSGGHFNLTGDVLDWRRATKSWSSSSGCDLEPIVRTAWSLFQEVNVSAYDADHNGKIDNLFVVHSGRIGRDRVGPECTFTESAHADHTVVFQSQGVGAIGEAIPIGFYIHEGGHGYYDLPDLYGDHYNGRYGVGMWGMMGLGAWGVRNDLPRADLFRYPAHFEPLSKINMGWVKPRVINRTQLQVEIKPVETHNDIVAVPARWGSNYYLEYRSKRGFSEEHPGHGLLVWQNYTVIQADGRDDLNHGTRLGRRPLPPISENFGDASDPFPGSANVTRYQDKHAGVTFANIVQDGDKIVLDIIIDGAGVEYVAPNVERFSGVERL